MYYFYQFIDAIVNIHQGLLNFWNSLSFFEKTIGIFLGAIIGILSFFFKGEE